jgi:hypothetical protein
MRRFAILAGVTALAAVMAVAALPAEAADHLDAPLVETDGRLDINDVYAFQSPTNSDNVVLAMTVNPVAGVESPTTFSQKGRYVLKIDADGDARADRRLRFEFSKPDAAGVQDVRLRGGEGLRANGTTGEDIAVAGGGTLHAGLFDDPFFFDLAAFRDDLNFCPGGVGTNFFAGLNVTAIVVEIPSEAVTEQPSDIGARAGESSEIGVWATTRSKDGRFDRMGRPAINTVFIPSDQKNAFNAGSPRDDQANFRDEVVATLLMLGNDQATADMLADVLLPDILTIDVSDPSGFLNGRRLQDDVIDAELNLISGGAITTDCVANDSTFQASFPYLGPPNT